MRHPLKIQNCVFGLVLGRIANALFRWARFAKARQGGWARFAKARQGEIWAMVENKNLK